MHDLGTLHYVPEKILFLVSPNRHLALFGHHVIFLFMKSI